MNKDEEKQDTPPNEHEHAPKQSLVSLKSKIAAWIVSAILAVAFFFGAYFIATSRDRQECVLCPTNEMEGIILPSLFWYSTWCMITTCITWILHFRQHFLSFNSSAALLPSMFRISLPLSVTVSLGYSFYILTNDWGRDFVDDDLCYTALSAATPKEGTSFARAINYLFFENFSNWTIHYLCAAINLSLYFKAGTRGPWRPVVPLAFIVIEGTFICIIHELFKPVYCTDNIFLFVLPMTTIFVFLHALFFYRRKSVAVPSPEQHDNPTEDNE